MLFKSDVVLAPRAVTVRVVFDPARTLINSLGMLNLTELRSGLGEWINQTVAAMPPDLRRDNEVAGQLFDVIDFADDPMDFPVLIDRIEAQDMTEALSRLTAHIAHVADVDPKVVLESRERYVDIIQGYFAKKGDECDAETVAASYDYMVDAAKCQQFLVTHLRTMWTSYIEAEWTRVRPVLLDTVSAFDKLDLSDLTPLEAIQVVTGRDLTNFWKDEDETEELIFIPSTHCGPYVSQWGKNEKNRTYIIYGARIPEGVESFSTELSLRELLVQFTALADDTRLHILALLTTQREVCSHDFQQMLDLSQSATSRHLRQLVACGFLNERRRDLNKYFSLNPRRVQETAASMRMLLSRK